MFRNLTLTYVRNDIIVVIQSFIYYLLFYIVLIVFSYSFFLDSLTPHWICIYLEQGLAFTSVSKILSHILLP